MPLSGIFKNWDRIKYLWLSFTTIGSSLLVKDVIFKNNLITTVDLIIFAINLLILAKMMLLKSKCMLVFGRLKDLNAYMLSEIVIPSKKTL